MKKILYTNINMNKQLYQYFDNTKQLHILLCIAMLLIIVTIVAPIGKGFINYSGRTVIIFMLLYILFKNFTETYNFSRLQKKDDMQIDFKNNILASYVLCGFILFLLMFVIFN
jgi:hypothetical protein